MTGQKMITEETELIKNWRKVLAVTTNVCNSTLYILENKAAINNGKDKEELEKARKDIADFIENEESGHTSQKQFDDAHAFFKTVVESKNGLSNSEKITYKYGKTDQGLLSIESKQLDLNNKTPITLVDVSGEGTVSVEDDEDTVSVEDGRSCCS